MPELPEVETVARSLRVGSPDGGPPLIGRVIERAQVFWAREVSGLPAAASLILAWACSGT